VRVGRVLGAFGVRGWAKCEYTTDHPELLATRQRYLLLDPVTCECLLIEPAAFKLHPSLFYLQIQGCDSRETMQRWAGWDLVYPARRGELPRSGDEVYCFELHGMEARRPDGVVLGTVTEVQQGPAHTLVAITGHPSRLIPFTRQFVPEVHLEEGYFVSTYPLDDVEEA